MKNEEILEKSLKYKLPIFLTTPDILVPKEIIKQIPYQFAKENLAVPLAFFENTLVIGLQNPFKAAILDEIRAEMPYIIKPAYATKEVLLEVIEKIFHQDETKAKDLISDLKDKEIKSDLPQVDLKDLLDDRDTSANIQLLNVILTEAIQLKASDVHFEPFENDFQIRYRIDGVLQKRHIPPKETLQPLMTRIKVLAKLDIAEQRLPQDGRIKLLLGQRNIDIRVSTIPVYHGERIVLRILDKSNASLDIDLIGMPQNILKQFKELIQSPEGIILVTGPTGSGKTTTLYSAISSIMHDEINIMTIEDPIEYKIHGIAQMGVQPKITLDFATGLRHILRQDPDVILIGEIRDKETAEIAIQASLTGHLVFSTLHTNDAASAITRLVDMQVEPYLLASSIIAILAQRLLRMICPYCKISYEASPEELQKLGIKDKITLYKGTGCKECFNLGYKGRCGVYELIIVNDKLKRQISLNQESSHLKEYAQIFSLKEHGRDIVLNGTTSLQEMLRVIKN
jgi:general secretion pathway protein E